ncbi:F-box/kelch-repeat protein At3g06240-like isoform X2 [Rutidosis leptorrhynchoides]|uniref:F-box/kelch-repeat protein At3g06240-like isoform X2 n=1 Tax=Rutidosis leptorrhynchoides TaxID=125765 RepID=UPI003A99B134
MFLLDTFSVSNPFPNHAAKSITSTSTSDRTVGLVLYDSSYKSIKIPIEIDLPFQVCGSCNGLICLSWFPFPSNILLWNPATRVFKDLPDSPNEHSLMFGLGFGFDGVVKDYKVLRFAHRYNGPIQAEMYSLRTNSWREITTPAELQRKTYRSTCSVFLNGKFHWTPILFESVMLNRLIMCFDIHEEAFSYIMSPEFEFAPTFEERVEVCWKVVALKESLSVIAWIKKGYGVMLFEVWLMKEYGVVSSWTKYTSFELQINVSKVLGCGLKGEFLLEADNKQLVVYDPISERVNNLGNHGVAHLSKVFNHVGSLIPINGGKVATRTNISSVVPHAFFD